VLAHVFFNLPLVTRLLLQAWTAIPAERFRVAESLGASPWAYFRLIEGPMLRATVPGAFLLVFLLCLTSFVVALAVGGGPRGTTIELAIYQAFRLDFDLGKAASLALVQFTICGALSLLAFIVPLPQTNGLGLDRVPQRLDWPRHQLWDGFWIFGAGAFLVLPLGAVLLRGLRHMLEVPPQILTASLTSLTIAIVSTALCLAMALSLSLAFARRGSLVRSLAEATGILGLASSPLVVGTGLFVLIFPYAQPMTFALPITTAVNAMMALPFALRVLMPAVQETYGDYLHLRMSLGMGRWIWMTRILGPRLRRPIGFSAGLAAALSMGDLGVIALFADPDLQTLPLMLYRLMGAYRMDQAAATAVVLVVQSLFLFWMFDRGGRRHAATG
jgi:thiamine transport system permease protein